MALPFAEVVKPGVGRGEGWVGYLKSSVLFFLLKIDIRVRLQVEMTGRQLAI